MTDQKMNPEIKALWIEALESGLYEKGTGVLHNQETNTYCCLGVLCDLAVKNGLDVSVHERRHNKDYQSVTAFDGASSVLPLSVQKWAGLPEENPDVYVTTAKQNLSVAEINDYGIPVPNEYDADNIPVAFVDIAALIRENF